MSTTVESSCLSRRRTVHFDSVVRVYQPTDWSYDDYRSARIGPWIRMAADRSRFQRRIRQIDLLIGHIFTEQYRAFRIINI